MLYVPFLKTKQGELAALEKLSPSCFNKIKPYHLFVNDTNKDRKGNYFDVLSTPISKIYESGHHSCYVDFSQFSSVPVVDVCNFLQSKSINFTVVLRDINITMDLATELRLKGMTSSGIAIVLEAQKQYNFDHLNARLEIVKDFFKIADSEIDLIIQFGFLTSNQYGYQLSSFQSIQQNLSSFMSFGHVITASGSFPKDVTAIEKDTIKDLPRYELSLYSELRKISKRDIIYGDYGNIHCIHDADAGGFEGSASLKYTTNGSFRIFRGIKPSEHPLGNSQYIEKCKELVNSKVFDGADFSFGDAEIFNCATNAKAKPGSATTWIRNTLNHHITRVVAERS